MASTSTSRPPSAGAPIVKLPSIHEMFPEHLVPRAASARPRASSTRALANVNPSPRNQFVPPPAAPPQQVYPSFSFEVLKSDPRSSSLEHIASSRPGAPPRRSVPRLGSSPILRAHAPPALITSSEGDGEMDVDGEEGEDGEGFEFAEEGKKHICPTCSKRFNRPSSLRIHVNTHTGATPFRCPHPSCGRAFNVNSNMRRHFRNHANDNNSPHSPTASSSSLSFNTHPPGPPLVTSFNSPASPSSSSPPSASWSASSRSSFASPSPVTPASATFPPSRHDPMFAADRWTLAPVPTAWNRRDGKHAHAHAQYESFSHARGYGYSESDVRSDRPR